MNSVQFLELLLDNLFKFFHINFEEDYLLFFLDYELDFRNLLKLILESIYLTFESI